MRARGASYAGRVFTQRLRRFAVSRAKKLGIRRPERLVDGYPPALEVSVLEAAISRAANDTALRVQHARLATSGRFLAAQTFRVRVKLRSGGRWSAIYKTVDLGPTKGTGFRREVARKLSNRVDSIPLLVYRGALDGPSGPERLSSYLPGVYHVGEAGFRYEVLLEDLAPVQSAGPATVGKVLRALPDLHDSLQDFIAERDPDRFTRDASAYRDAIAACTIEAIVSYREAHGSRRAASVGAQEGPVAEWQSKKLSGLALRPIHGDFTSSNVLFRRGEPGFKVIDWERTMIGYPHQDLAALVRRMPARVQHEAVELYATTAPDAPPETHRSAYAFCKRMHKLKEAAIWSLWLDQDDLVGSSRGEARVRQRRQLQERIERNLGEAESLGLELLSS